TPPTKDTKLFNKHNTRHTMQLYHQKPYAKHSKAKATKITGTQVTLDQTPFYPGGGGQPPDTGTINGIRVTQVHKDDDTIIHHLEQEPPFKEGDAVQATIDWERRHKIMRIHTSLHLLINTCETLLGPFEVVGSGISEDKGHIDLYYPERIRPEVRKTIEEVMNQAIKEGAEVKTRFEGEDRHVKIDDHKEMKCGGTHVKNIREIGPVRLKRRNVGKGKDRIEVHPT
ncbi:MAG: alanyl-tRNA editing protein, partial [Candidatus Bathyarchaeia archaeon]